MFAFLGTCFLVAGSLVAAAPEWSEARESNPHVPRGETSSFSKVPYMAVFGDSYSDNGTGYYNLMVEYVAGNMSAGAVKSGGSAAESWLAMGEAAMVSVGVFQPPYYRHADSDGPTWPEHVAKHYDVDVYNYAVCSSVSGGTNTTQPALYYPCGYHPLGPPDGKNFIPAVDVLLRAMQDQNRAMSSVPIPSMLQQVDTYLKVRPTIEASAVHFIYTGTADAYSFFDVNRTAADAPAFANGLASAIIEGMDRLYAAGARKFGIFSLSPILPTPYIARISAFKDFAVKGATELDRLCKPALEAALKAWQTKNYDAHVITFSLADLYKEWKANMPNSGFTNMDDKCYNNTVQGFAQPSPICHQPQAVVCYSPTDYFFWDEYHPTGAAHQALASHVIPIVKPFFLELGIPEREFDKP